MCWIIVLRVLWIKVVVGGTIGAWARIRNWVLMQVIVIVWTSHDVHHHCIVLVATNIIMMRWDVSVMVVVFKREVNVSKTSLFPIISTTWTF
jgi:hypothetical protein